MMNHLAFEAVDCHLKDICDNQNAFSGKLVLLGGDFRQILLVITHGSRNSIFAATIHRATFWNECSILHLRINMRLQQIDEPNKTMHIVDEFALQVEGVEVQGIAISDNGEPIGLRYRKNSSYGMTTMVCTI